MVLQSIRERLTGIIAIFVFGILIIPFAFVGVSSYFTSDALNAVAVVNDQEITANEFNQGFQNYRRRMQAQMGTAFDAEAFDQAVVRRQYLDQLIDEELLAQVAVDAGLAVSDEMLAERIRTLPGFEVDGEFNADVYQATLTAQGLTPQQFENDMRTSMVLTQFPATVAESAIATQTELRQFARLQDQQRAFKAIVVPALPETPAGDAASAEAMDEVAEPGADEQGVDEPLVENPEADDQVATEEAAAAAPAAEGQEPAATPLAEEALVAWYEEHQSEYYSEERVVVEYVELDAAMLGGEVEPDEELLKARFEEQQARFITPESRLASHILIEVDPEAPQVEVETAKQQAEELARRAREGEDFAALAREHSQDIGSAEEGGDLGWIEPGYMVRAFEDALYELSLERPVSEPVETGFGWHVIQLRDIRPAEGMTFTEARDILLAEYRTEADERRFLEQADRLIDIIYEDPTTLSAAAEELGLEVREAGPFGRLGGVEGIAANPEVVAAAFSDLVLAQHAVSDPIDLGENHILLIRLKEHLPEALKPLEEVRDQVAESVRRHRAMEAARATAQELLDSLEGGAGIAELAESSGLELIEAEAARRTSAEIAPTLRNQVFLMEAPGEDGRVTQVVELDDGYAVVQLDQVTDGTLPEDDAVLKLTYSRRVTNGSASAETIAFLRMLREQSTIEVFEDRL
ncbi:MAG: SurA N-terminal domain-containing protein [Lysobacterales bacterium]